MERGEAASARTASRLLPLRDVAPPARFGDHLVADAVLAGENNVRHRTKRLRRPVDQRVRDAGFEPKPADLNSIHAKAFGNLSVWHRAEEWHHGRLHRVGQLRADRGGWADATVYASITGRRRRAAHAPRDFGVAQLAERLRVPINAEPCGHLVQLPLMRRNLELQLVDDLACRIALRVRVAVRALLALMAE